MMPGVVVSFLLIIIPTKGCFALPCQTYKLYHFLHYKSLYQMFENVYNSINQNECNYKILRHAIDIQIGLEAGTNHLDVWTIVTFL